MWNCFARQVWVHRKKGPPSTNEQQWANIKCRVMIFPICGKYMNYVKHKLMNGQMQKWVIHLEKEVFVVKSCHCNRHEAGTDAFFSWRMILVKIHHQDECLLLRGPSFGGASFNAKLWRYYWLSHVTIIIWTIMLLVGHCKENLR